MKRSFRLGQLFGVDIQVHATFLLIVLWYFWTGWREGGWRRGLGSALFGLCLFGGIVLHELGHSLMARRFGIATRSITLFPIGGVAGLAKIPRRPGHELAIALAGPAVSFALAGLLLAARGGWPAWASLAEGPRSLGGLLDLLAVANFALGAFNLIPAFPMDGGRALRALMAWFVSYERATAAAAYAGQAFALALAALGVYIGQPFTVALGVFLIVLARREHGQVRMAAALGERRACDLMDVGAFAAPPDLPVATALAAFGADGGEIPVVAEGRLVGLLDLPSARRALRAGRGESPVSEWMRRRFIVLPPDAPLREIAPWLARGGQSAYPVAAGGVLLGMLRAADVRIAGARPRRPAASGGWRLDFG